MALIVPVFNEAGSILPFLHETGDIIDPLETDDFGFSLIFVNDGSTDSTLETLVTAQKADPRIRIIDLSRNFGKEAALTAGLDACSADAAIPIDVDLQDPPEVIPQLLEHWRKGSNVVIAKRLDRSSDTLVKSKTAFLFYRVHNMLSKTQIPENVGDFRLMDRAVLDVLKDMPERRRFMKGLFAWVGFETAIVEYKRAARSDGRTTFTPWKLWNFALEGITSFSNLPLEIWGYVGSAISALAFLYGGLLAGRAIFIGADVPGYTSLMTSILFLGGVQLIGIGVLGQYLGRVYEEVKRRPVYVVRKVYEGDE
ncbi:glycosyltransferase family 2 protein [Oricola cellulosilytica]|uniref:glycosyltransferase family 2 protein n=1 Tax=Oricola cellulosilytica TaxID=1429082 RepID=UPI001CC1641E|nr:glycosyltransferase family 2 protein [Oricola cellulosilytica]